MKAQRTEAPPTNGLAREGPGTDGREEVLRAAAVAFMARGFDGTSIDDIADQMKSTKGRIYHYYRSKQAIYLDVRLTQLRMLLDALEAVEEPKRPADKRLHRMIRTQVLLLARERQLMFAAVSSRFVEIPVEGKPELRAAVEQIAQMLQRLENIYRSAIIDGIKQGVFRKVDVVVAEKTCVSSAQMAVVWIHQIETSPESVADAIADQLVRGLLK
jgi:AcrR family transcriptional regulator